MRVGLHPPFSFMCIMLCFYKPQLVTFSCTIKPLLAQLCCFGKQIRFVVFVISYSCSKTRTKLLEVIVHSKKNIYSKLLCPLLLTCAVDFSRFAQVGLAVITLLDIVLVSRLHVQYGIADKYMVLWGSALGDAINQFKYALFSCEPSSSMAFDIKPFASF